MQRKGGWMVAVVVLVAAVLGGVGAGVVLVNRNHPTPKTATQSTDATVTTQPQIPSAQPSGLQPTFFPKPEQPNTTTPPPDLDGVFARVRSGVVRVLASTCSGTGIGTGFLTSGRTAVVALSSVDRAVATVVVVGGRPIPATVSAVSPDAGLALLRLDRPATGYRFARGSAPAAGQSVGVVGVPATGKAAELTRTAVTATDQHGSGLSGLLALEGSADLGLSGAPVVDGSGAVLGMVVADKDEKRLTAVPATTLAGARPEAPHKGSCGKPHGPRIATAVSGDAPSKLRSTLHRYFAGINKSDYDAVFAAFEPGVLRGSRSQIEQGFRSTYDFNVRIAAWQGPNVWVRFDSIFADGKGPRGGLTCARWSRVFVFREAAGRARISRVENRTDVPLFRPC